MGIGERFKPVQGEAGYSWLYRAPVRNGVLRVMVTLFVIGLAAGFFVWYIRTGNDASPDSPVGLGYAGAGTLLLLLAMTLYSVRRRSHRTRALGGLRGALGWHMCLGLMGLALICIHSFGELNLRTGTYTLYGMIALVISGLVGRAMDRLIPRLTASAVDRSLTAQGDDRIDTISEKLEAIVVHNTQHVRGFVPPNEDLKAQSDASSSLPSSRIRAVALRDMTLHTPWDLAYISLESTPQELNKEAEQYRFIPDKKSALVRPGALMPGTQEQIGELEEVRHAMKQELFYRHISLYWRRFHILLALTTLGLLIWHIVYAIQLWLH